MGIVDPKYITEEAIIGIAYEAQASLGMSLVDSLCMKVGSQQEIHNLGWLMDVPGVAKHTGTITRNKLRGANHSVRIDPWHSNFEVPLNVWLWDKLSQVSLKVQQLMVGFHNHPDELLTEVLEDAETALCYDGKSFFATNHEEGISGVQSNDITSTAATPTAPTANEMSTALFAAKKALMKFKSDTGRLVNGQTRSFIVYCPADMEMALRGALNSTTVISGGAAISNPLAVPDAHNMLGQPTFKYFVDPNLSWTDKIVVIADHPVIKPFIYASERTDGATNRAIPRVFGPGTEYSDLNQVARVQMDEWRAMTTGFWQKACMVTFTT